MSGRIVFVYGSLREGMGNSYLLDDSEYCGKFTTAPEYTLVSLGGYPAVIEQGTTAIVGELYSVSDAVWGYIESLEGYPTYYGATTLQTPLGEARMYTLDESYLEYPQVESGDWVDYASNPCNSRACI